MKKTMTYVNMNLIKGFFGSDPLAVTSSVRKVARISYSLDITLDISKVTFSLNHHDIMEILKRIANPPLEIRSVILYLLATVRSFRVIKGPERTVGIKWDLAKLSVPTDFPERFDRRWNLQREGVINNFQKPIFYKMHISLEPGAGGTSPDFKILSLLTDQEREENYTKRGNEWVFN
ncbi:putative matrix protein [Dillard's Draw virus]|uniref:Putative matrix protein n=1 Tax=Dillard's Draw virus TaxID=2315722 RepID=A0A385KKX7_9RHAB|nr:putative matrix protein [Dillard's Draw virus]AXZ78337.1 putative matrix protein [Dillard's Draw virus]